MLLSEQLLFVLVSLPAPGLVSDYVCVSVSCILNVARIFYLFSDVFWVVGSGLFRLLNGSTHHLFSVALPPLILMCCYVVLL